jgi:hypothetical protein
MEPGARIIGSLIIALGLLVDDGIIAVEMMVVKMEGGWDRVKAAAHSYAATAMPRLTGALITVAAFMPISLQIDHRRIRGRHFLDCRYSRAARGSSPGSSRPTSPSTCCQGLRQAPRRRPVRPPFYRKLRGWIDLAIERRWWVIGATVAALAVAVVRRFVPQQFFPTARGQARRRAASQGRRFVRRNDRAGEEDGGNAEAGRGSALLHRVHGRRPARFYLSLNPELPTQAMPSSSS